jgi:hypothetical protein
MVFVADPQALTQYHLANDTIMNGAQMLINAGFTETLGNLNLFLGPKLHKFKLVDFAF